MMEIKAKSVVMGKDGNIYIVNAWGQEIKVIMDVELITETVSTKRMDNMEWKELDKATPLEVLIDMNKYQIQLNSTGTGWRDTQVSNEVDLFEKINNGFLEYRYRLKPLKPMEVIAEIFSDMSGKDPKRWSKDKNTNKNYFDGREVIIID